MSVTVVGSLVEALPGLIEEAAAIRHESAERIIEASKANAAQVTGALKASHYRVDERGSTYAQATAAALAANADAAMLPEVSAEKDTTIVAVAVEYGAPAEYYTGPTNPDAHPYFTPAVEAERGRFAAAVKGVKK